MATTTNLGITLLEVGQGQKEVTVNEGFAAFDKAIAQHETRDVSGGSQVDLTAVELDVATLEFIGTLTADIDVTIPDGTERVMVFMHSATGGFDITVRTFSGTGVTLMAADVLLLVSDGTDVFAISGTGAGGLAIGNTVVGGTAGSVLFIDGAGNLDQDNAEFYFDDTSKELGLGISGANIVAKLHIRTSADPSVIIESEDAGVLGPVLKFLHDSASPAVDDDIGVIRFSGDNSSAAEVDYAEIRAVIVSPTASSEEAKLEFYAQDNGTLTLLTTMQPSASPVMVVNGSAQFDGWFQNIRTVTTTVTLDDTDSVVLANATGGAFTVNLPTAASIDGRQFTIKKIDGNPNTVTVDAAGSELIDQSLTVALASQNQFITIVSDGTGWRVTATNIAAAGVTGTGVTNKVAIWSSTSSITSDTELEYDPSGNRLAIGHASPIAPLSVNSTGLVGSFPNPGAANLPSIHIRPTGTSGETTAITFGASSSGRQNQAQGGIYTESAAAFGLRMHFATTNVFTTGAQTRMTILETGQVGIGILTPVSPLDVSGHIAITDGVTAPGAATGRARIYVDSADGDLKVVFADGFVAIIAADS